MRVDRMLLLGLDTRVDCEAVKPSSTFATTRWSIVEAAASDDPGARDRALAEFSRCYRAPCEAWLRASGFGRDHAEEIVQSFFVEVVIGRALLASADRGQGSLRSLVLRALGNHRTDHLRRESTRHRHELQAGTGRTASQSDAEADHAFDLAWASAQLAEAIERVRRSSMGTQREAAWRAFERNILLPAIHGTARLPLADLAREAGIADAPRASVLLGEMRRRVLRTLEQVVTETAVRREDIEAELALVRRCLEG